MAVKSLRAQEVLSDPLSKELELSFSMHNDRELSWRFCGWKLWMGVPVGYEMDSSRFCSSVLEIGFFFLRASMTISLEKISTSYLFETTPKP